MLSSPNPAQGWSLSLAVRNLVPNLLSPCVDALALAVFAVRDLTPPPLAPSLPCSCVLLFRHNFSKRWLLAVGGPSFPGGGSMGTRSCWKSQEMRTRLTPSREKKQARLRSPLLFQGKAPPLLTCLVNTLILERQQGGTVIQACYADQSTAVVGMVGPRTYTVCVSLRAQSLGSLRVCGLRSANQQITTHPYRSERTTHAVLLFSARLPFFHSFPCSSLLLFPTQTNPLTPTSYLSPAAPLFPRLAIL
jgi:hypothetical protein